MKELEKQIVYTLAVYIVMYDKNKHPYFASLDYKDAQKFPEDPVKFKEQLFKACEDIVSNYETLTSVHIVEWKFVKKDAYDKIMSECEMENTIDISFGEND